MGEVLGGEDPLGERSFALRRCASQSGRLLERFRGRNQSSGFTFPAQPIGHLADGVFDVVAQGLQLIASGWIVGEELSG